MTLQDWLTANDLSDEQFGAMVQASPHGVRKWRRGERLPRPKLMRRILRATGGEVTLDDFYMESAE